jgi:hypothetical protein
VDLESETQKWTIKVALKSRPRTCTSKVDLKSGP